MAEKKSTIPPYTEPILDQDGRMTLSWRRFFESQWSRTGGFQDDVWLAIYNGLSTATQVNALNLQISDVNNALAAIRAEISAKTDQSSRVADLESEVAELRALILSRPNLEGMIRDLEEQIAANNQSFGLIIQKQEALRQDAESRAAVSESLAMQFNSSRINDSRYTMQDIGTINTRIDNLNTDQIAEGANLYFTTSRARSSISASGSLSYDSTTGVMSYTAPSLGTAAYQNTGNSGANVPLLNGVNTWSGVQTFPAGSGISGNAGTPRELVGYTGSTRRWRMVLGNGAAESGGNVGSNFLLSLYDDAGTTLTNVITIDRNTGLVAFPVGINVGVYTATPGTITGYITVNDAVGNPRKLAVIT